MKTILFKDVPVVQSRQEIVVDGDVLGWVEISTGRFSHKYHVGLQLRNIGELFQGFGDTPEEAIGDAFRRGDERLNNAAFQLSELKHRIAGL